MLDDTELSTVLQENSCLELCWRDFERRVDLVLEGRLRDIKLIFDAVQLQYKCPTLFDG